LSFWTNGDKTTWHQVLNNTSHLTMWKALYKGV
jgi:hypothetical protein